MRKLTYFTSILFLLLFTATSYAQVGRIQQTTVEYDDRMVDALTVTLTPERKDAQKAFDDWIDDRYDINMKGGGLFSDKNIRSAEMVRIPAISTDDITLVARTEERGGETRMTLFAMKANGNSVEAEDYRAFSGIEDVFDGFLSDFLPEYYEERVAEAREELEDLKKDFGKHQEDITDNEDKIKKLQKENEEHRREMTDLDRKIKDAERQLEERQAARRAVNRSVGNDRRD